MRWFDTPPCSRLDVASSSPDHLRLVGPSVGERLAGGAAAGFGAVFASVGASFLRLPIPAPFKLVPLAFTAIGAGVAALGASAALAQCSVEVERGRGLTLRWKLVGRDERSLTLAPETLEAFEVTSHVSRDSESGTESVEYRLQAVTRDGRAVAIEAFGTRAQANLRQRDLEARLLAPR